MSVLTGNNIKVKTFLFPLILIVGLCYGCEDKPKEQVIDPNNLFQFVLKDEIAKLHVISEKKRLSAIKHEIDSFVVSNHVRYFKKDGDFVWTIYRAHYDLNQSTCVTKLKLLTENTLIE